MMHGLAITQQNDCIYTTNEYNIYFHLLLLFLCDYSTNASHTTEDY
jgi:hypothetical protein